MDVKLNFKLFIIIIFFITSCISIPDKPNDSEIGGTYHVVKPGDNLKLISQKYHVDLYEISDINGLENNHKLRVGQWLFIPNLDPIGQTIARLQKSTPEKKPANNTKSQKIFDFPLKSGKIIQKFSRDKLKPYDGIAIQAKRGTPVLAAADGKILFVGDDGTKFGLLILIEHDASYITVYTNLDKSLVSSGQHVKRHTQIAHAGPILHFQVRVNQRAKDPLLYLKSTP